MDEFEIDDSLDVSLSGDSSLDLFESSGDAFNVMDSVEVPTIEDTSFDSIESGNMEDYSYENTELFNDEVSSVMNGVEVEELMFDDQVEESYRATPNSEIELLQEGLPEQDTSGYEELTREEYIEDSPKTLVREITPEILESRNADTEEVLDNYRENLREYGIDEDVIEQFVSQERDKINAEYESLDRGDLESNHYKDPVDWEGIASRLKEGWLEDTTVAGNIDCADTEIEPIDPSEIDYDEIFEGLDSYDFDGIDFLQDAERLDDSLSAFQPERWQELNLDQQKEAMTELAEYVQEVTGMENPPIIEFYNNPVDGDYGGYIVSTNTLSINEHMLYDSNEAADTVAHELWHAYQHERAMHPQSAKDYQYQYNFEHYISPKRDMFGRYVNFTEYQDQLVEAEARAFAEQFKGRLGGYGGAN